MKGTILDLKEKAKVEYEDKLKQLESEYKKKIEAIDIVRSLMENDNKTISIEKPPQTSIKNGMATSQIAREIIDRLQGDFSVHDIQKEASNMNPPLEVSKNVLHNVLKKKREGNQIEVVVAGAGRAPSIYKKTDKYVPQQKAKGN